MQKDYSKLKNLKTPECISDTYNEKEIEGKYSPFLDWLIDNIEKKESLNTFIDVVTPTVIPYSFKESLFRHFKGREPEIYFDINRYLGSRHLVVYHQSDQIHYKLIGSNEMYWCAKKKQKELEEKIHQKIQQKLDIDICKSNIADMSKRIFDLENENTSIMKKLEEQIELNSKLCQRIFEMKEDTFKEEIIINKPISSFPDEIYALQKKIRILEEMIKDRI